MAYSGRSAWLIFNEGVKRDSKDLWCSLECTPPCQGGGRGFKSRQVRHQGVRVSIRYPGPLGRVAQLVERAPEKREVTGSTPVPTTEKDQFRRYFDSQSILKSKFRAHNVLPTRK